MHSRALPPLRKTLGLLLGLAVLLVCSCMQDNPPGGGTEGNGIQLTGRVLGKNDAPAAGVVVTLVRKGLSDTTDALGRYDILSPQGGGKATGSALDTLAFFLDGKRVESLPVLAWIAELPDVRLVQRDLYGSLLPSGVVIERLEAVVYPQNAKPGDTLVKALFHNQPNSSYSGFAYFSAQNPPSGYAAYVNVYGNGARLTGRSQTLLFDGSAGDLAFPAFDPGNAFPRPDAGKDSTGAAGTSFTLRGTATDAFGGSIAKWEWNIGGGPFRTTAGGDTTLTLPGAREDYPCVLRVTDDAGNTALDTVLLDVTNIAPRVEAGPDTTVAIGATVTLRASASDADGIRKYFWDFDGDGARDDSTEQGMVTRTFSSPASTVHAVIVTAQDSFGGEARDTLNVFTLAAGVVWTPRASGTTQHFRGLVWTGSKLVAVGSGGSILTSPDGISWTVVLTDPKIPFLQLAFSGTKLVALGMGIPNLDTSHYASIDGISWTKSRFPRVTEYSYLGGEEGRFTATRNSSSAAVSTDGLAWTTADTYLLSPLPMLWTGTQYLCIATMGGEISRSPDGTAWTKTAVPAIPKGLSGVIRTAKGLYGITQEGMSYTATLDGQTWTAVPPGAREAPDFVNFGGSNRVTLRSTGDQVAFPYGDKIYLSPDQGAHWTARPLAGRPTHMVWTGTRFVAVGDSGKVWTSP